MDYTKQIKDYILGRGMAMVGVASVDRFDDVPYGRKPTEILPGAKSVIVFGARMPDGAVQARFRVDQDGLKDAENVYGRYSHGATMNVHLMYTTYIACHYIERLTGKAAMPTMNGPISISRPFSHRHAAVAAGLGEFGWNNAVVTPEFGPRIRFGAIVTTLELTPDPLYNGPRLCDPSVCRVCVDICPTRALPAYGEKEPDTFSCAEKYSEFAAVNRNRCCVACYGLNKANGAKENYVTSEDPTDAEIRQAIDANTPPPGTLTREPTWKCDRCIAYCPVGNWKEKFVDTGLVKI